VPVNVAVDADLRKRVIDGVNSNLSEYYVDAPLAKKMAHALQAHARAGDYETDFFRGRGVCF
jgi:hypothetical protein